MLLEDTGGVAFYTEVEAEHSADAVKTCLDDHATCGGTLPAVGFVSGVCKNVGCPGFGLPEYWWFEIEPRK